MKYGTFPQVIFVTVEQDGSTDWLSANATTDGSLGDNDKVVAGVYQFVRADEIRRSPPTLHRRKTRKTS